MVHVGGAAGCSAARTVADVGAVQVVGDGVALGVVALLGRSVTAEDRGLNLTQTLRDAVDRRARQHEETEERHEAEDDAGAPERQACGQRATGDDAEHSAGVTHGVDVTRGRASADEVSDTGGAEGEDAETDRHAVGGLVAARVAEHVQTHADEHDRQDVGDDAERSRGDGVDDVTEHAGQVPPLARRDNDAEGEEEEADAVATVLRLEFGGAGADATHGASGDVGNPHPGATSGTAGGRRALLSRARTAPLAGRALGGRLLAGRFLRRGGAGARGGGAPTVRGTLLRYENAVVRGCFPCRHPARLREEACSSSAPRRGPRDDLAAPRGGVNSESHLTIRATSGTFVDGSRSRVSRCCPVTSSSAQPRLAGRQPSTAVGCSG